MQVGHSHHTHCHSSHRAPPPASQLTTPSGSSLRQPVSTASQLYHGKKRRGEHVRLQLTSSSVPRPADDAPLPRTLVPQSPPVHTEVCSGTSPAWMEEATEARHRLVEARGRHGPFHFAPRTLRAVGLSPALNGDAPERDASSAAQSAVDAEDAAAFSDCPPISAAATARAGDVLLYRVMELSEAWTPSLSSYRSARVTSVDHANERVTTRPTAHVEVLRRRSRSETRSEKRQRSAISAGAGDTDDSAEQLLMAWSELLDVRVVEGPSYTASLQQWRERQRRERKGAKWADKQQHRAAAEQDGGAPGTSAAATTSPRSSASSTSSSAAPPPPERRDCVPSTAPSRTSGLSAALARIRQRPTTTIGSADLGNEDELAKRKAALLQSVMQSTADAQMTLAS